MPREKRIVILKTLLMVLFIKTFRLLTDKLANSGINKLLKEEISALGNRIIGITIPEIIPYCARAVSQEAPNFSRRVGTSNCFKVERPERMQEVEVTGMVIPKIVLKNDF